MAAGGMMLRLALAALVSAGTSGLIVPILLGLALLLDGNPQIGFDVRGSLLLLSVGIAGGLVVATLPAFFAGAWLWAFGDRFGRARLPAAWAAAGASVGGALWALFGAATGAFHRGPGGFEALTLAVSLAAGAGGALAFRAIMLLTAATGAGAARPER
jgi:hypothetical protein